MIAILDRNDEALKDVLNQVHKEDGFHAAVLFVGDRWQHVEVAAVGYVDGEAVGMASLAPTNEEGRGDPHVIGLYVMQTHRGEGWGYKLLEALIEESKRRYQQPPEVDCINQDSLRVAMKLAHTGLKINAFC